MSLRTTVAAPFKEEGSDEMGESAFVVALSLDRDWFSPDQAKRLVDVAVSEGVLERNDGTVRVTFDPASVDVPDGFNPAESLLQGRSTFERVLSALVDAGHSKQDAVAAVNRLQSELQISIEAAAVLYAHGEGVDVQTHAEAALKEL